MARIARWTSDHLKPITIGILAVGLSAAIATYFLAPSRPDNPLGYDPLQTKLYRHQLEVYGGQANVLAAEFRDWFDSLWYGRNLAYTIAVLTVLLVGAVRLGTAMSLADIDAEEEDDSAPPRPWPPRRV